MASDEKEIMEEVGRLVQSAFDLGGVELLREVEELFLREAAKARAEAQGGMFSDSIADAH